MPVADSAGQTEVYTRRQCPELLQVSTHTGKSCEGSFRLCRNILPGNPGLCGEIDPHFLSASGIAGSPIIQPLQLEGQLVFNATNGGMLLPPCLSAGSAGEAPHRLLLNKRACTPDNTMKA